MDKPISNDEYLIKLTMQNKEKLPNYETVGDFENSNEKNRIAWFTYIPVVIVNLLTVSVGIFSVWPSPVIPKLVSNNTDINPLGFPATSFQISIITSMPYVCSTISYIPVAMLSNKVGRRKMLIYLSVCLVPIFTSIAFATHIYIYYINFSVLGVVYSGTFINVPIYSIEISEDYNRGRITSSVGMVMSLGMLCGYIFGPIISVKYFTLMIAAPPLLFLLLCPFVVETPYYLTSMGKRSEAINSLKKLRRHKHFSEIKVELRMIEETVNLNSTKVNTGGFLELFKSRVARRALLISSIICITQQMSGIRIIMAYGASIFNEAGSYLSGNQVGVLVGSVQLFFFLISLYCIEKLGRRQLLLFSTLSCSISLSALACYFYFKDINVAIPNELRCFPVICIIIFVTSYSLGLGPIPITMMCELFNTRLRVFGRSTVMVFNYLVIFITLFVFPIFKESFGMCYSILFYSVAGLVGFILMYIFLVETKNKTFNEIQDILRKTRS